jgi:hypothetical protein
MNYIHINSLPECQDGMQNVLVASSILPSTVEVQNAVLTSLLTAKSRSSLSSTAPRGRNSGRNSFDLTWQQPRDICNDCVIRATTYAAAKQLITERAMAAMREAYCGTLRVLHRRTVGTQYCNNVLVVEPQFQVSLSGQKLQSIPK